MKAHPDDILVVAWPEEARSHPQFMNSQIRPVSRPESMHGRKFRIAWVTTQAYLARNARFWGVLHGEAYFNDSEIRDVETYSEEDQ